MKKFLKAVGVTFLSLAGLLIAVCFGLMAYFQFACPTPPIVDDRDLLLDETEVPADENAYVAILAITNELSGASVSGLVISAYEKLCEGNEKLLKYWREDATPEICRAGIDRILAERAEGLAGLHRALKLPQYRLTPDSERLFFPPISALTLAHTLLRVQAFRAYEKGNFAVMLEAARDASLLSTLIRDNASSVVECFVGVALNDVICRKMVLLANEANISDDSLASFAELLSTDFDEDSLFKQTLKREYMNFSRKVFETIDDKISENELRQMLQETEKLFSLTGRRKLCPAGLLMSSAFVRFAYNKELSRQNMADVFRAGLAGRDLDEVVPMPDSCFCPNFVGRSLIRTCLPTFDGLRCRLRSSLFYLRAARTVVAVLRYCRAHDGARPADLSALVPTYLSEVPSDPFASDRALGYDAERGFVWTVGDDGAFNPFETGDRSNSTFDRKMAKYTLRLDGKPYSVDRKKGSGK